ncbi:MAG: 3-phosphoshikimate 1-carboxyvinyltransferase [Thaumarchaeota archaeon]|nr:3-phosphoshikimate 1-carboxyvinyltransferase [Candidatus Calditenuaceae archaeon]MDW8187109.1 3-phosphoshikimate 1-carboxyvinyltransferase [Nitrososphaerota archaeon]
MKVLALRPSGEIVGEVRAPPSKSYTHRALFVASLAVGESVVTNPLVSRDTTATFGAIKGFGADLELLEGFAIVEGREPRVPEDVINALNSGTTLRIATAVGSLVKEGYSVLTGDDSLRRRPMQPLLDALSQLGVEAWSTRRNGCAPVVVRGRGSLQGYCRLRGDVSSQFLSALAIAGSASEGETEVEVVGELVSRPYVSATIETIRAFGGLVSFDGRRLIAGGRGVRRGKFNVPGDYGLAAFVMVVPVLLGGSVRVTGIDPTLPQADATIVDVLERMGARVKHGEGYVETFGSTLEGIEVDLRDAPDLLPVVAILGLFAEGSTTIRGVKHARYKESDRLAVLSEELKKVGAVIEEFEDGLSIANGTIKEAVLNPRDDHRLFMAFAVLSAATHGKIKTLGVESVDVSYPNFLRDIISLGCEVLEFGR